MFNGNGYDKGWPKEADARGIWRIDSGVEATKRFTAPKNVDLFSRHKIFSPDECAARQAVLLGHYTGTIETEALTMARKPFACPHFPKNRTNLYPVRRWT